MTWIKAGFSVLGSSSADRHERNQVMLLVWDVGRRLQVAAGVCTY